MDIALLGAWLPELTCSSGRVDAVTMETDISIALRDFFNLSVLPPRNHCGIKLGELPERSVPRLGSCECVG